MTCPGATVVANPELLIVAVFVSDELHVTPLVKSALDPSLYVAVATYC